MATTRKTGTGAAARAATRRAKSLTAESGSYEWASMDDRGARPRQPEREWAEHYKLRRTAVNDAVNQGIDDLLGRVLQDVPADRRDAVVTAFDRTGQRMAIRLGYVADAAYQAGAGVGATTTQATGGESTASQAAAVEQAIIAVGDALLAGRRTYTPPELAAEILKHCGPEAWPNGRQPSATKIAETLRSDRRFELKNLRNLKLKGRQFKRTPPPAGVRGSRRKAV